MDGPYAGLEAGETTSLAISGNRTSISRSSNTCIMLYVYDTGGFHGNYNSIRIVVCVKTLTGLYGDMNCINSKRLYS
jgi:hypothetical protein